MGRHVHAYKEARKLYRASVRQSKRAHSKHLKATLLDKMHQKRQTCIPCCATPSASTNPHLLDKRGRLT